MKKFLFLIFTLLSVSSFSQNKFRFPVWLFHDDSTSIIGFSSGLNLEMANLNSIKVYGINIELLGLGILVPLVPSAPISEDSSQLKNAALNKLPIVINGINLSPLGSLCECEINGFAINGIGNIIKRTNGFSASVLINFTEKMNGLQLGSLGFSSVLNGAQISVWHSVSYIKINGFQFSLLGNRANISNGFQISITNFSQNHKGIQIGIYNKTKKLKGLQIGLWNVNEKRKLPFINW